MNIKQFINHKQKLGFVNGNDILCLNFQPFEQSAGQNCLLLMASIPYHKGKRAKVLGMKITINPYPSTSKAFKAWQQGYKGERLL